MKKLLMIIPLILLYSCGVNYKVVQENVSKLNTDTLKLNYSNGIVAIPLQQGSPYYTVEYNFDNVGADTLYSICRVVMPDIFVSAESVIQIDDATLKTIVGKGISKQTIDMSKDADAIFLPIYTHNVNYTIRIRCYDGKVQFSIYNIYARNYQATSLYTSGNVDYRIEECIQKGVDKEDNIQENIYGALFLAIDKTASELPLLFIDKIDKYLDELN